VGVMTIVRKFTVRHLKIIQSLGYNFCNTFILGAFDIFVGLVNDDSLDLI